MTKSINLRELALEILLETEKEGTYPTVLLKQALDRYLYMEKQERAFLTRLVEGTIERQITLDYYLDQVSKTPVKKMKPVIRCIMRMAVYQIFFMDAVPESAACNEAVKLAQKKGFRTLTGFVNGVLRNLLRKKDQMVLPPEDSMEYLSVKYSMPMWFVKKMIEQYGREQTEKMFAACYEDTSAITVRVNTSKVSFDECVRSLLQEQITVEQAPYVENALKISGYDALPMVEAFQKGYFQVQDLSSMLPCIAAAPQKGWKVIDLCAAPGGKSIHAADLVGEQGMVEARDLTEYKTALIRENITRCKMEHIHAVCADARVLDENSIASADLVIADLPCSGLGVLKKKSDIKYRMDEKQILELQKLQREILKNAALYVKPGGILLYSTCTVTKEENEEQVEWILDNLPVKSVSLDPVLPKELQGETTAKGYLQLLPGREKTDGFFLAKFTRI